MFYYRLFLLQTNTFQCVLVTDTERSFAIFLYAEDGIQWTTGEASGGINGLGGNPAQVGFNAGDGIRFFSVPGAQTNDIVNIDTTTNVGRAGVWMFRVDGEEIISSSCSIQVDGNNNACCVIFCSIVLHIAQSLLELRFVS